MDRYPLRLQRPALVSVVFEMRYTPTTPHAGDLLPGLLYGKGVFGDLKVEEAANLPRQLLEMQPELNYQPTHTLTLKDQPGTVFRLGPKVAQVSPCMPYEGWVAFKEQIQRLAGYMRETNLVQNVERIAIRATNVISHAPPQPPLDMVNVQIEACGKKVPGRGCQLRWEWQNDRQLTIVQIMPDATVWDAAGSPRVGLLLDVDSMQTGGSIWSDFATEVESVHTCCKSTFFDLLTDETVSRLGPVWD